MMVWCNSLELPCMSYQPTLHLFALFALSTSSLVHGHEHHRITRMDLPAALEKATYTLKNVYVRGDTMLTLPLSSLVKE